MSSVTEPQQPATALGALRVADVMTPGVVSVPASVRLDHAYAAMAAHRVHAVLVCDADTAEPLGWVTAVTVPFQLLLDIRRLSVTEAIDETVAVIQKDATVDEAARRLREPGRTRLLVAEAQSVGSALSLDPTWRTTT